MRTVSYTHLDVYKRQGRRSDRIKVLLHEREGFVLLYKRLDANVGKYLSLIHILNGKKDVLGMYVGENESAKFWLSIMNGLKNRGVEDILIACVDEMCIRDRFKSIQFFIDIPPVKNKNQ